MNIKEFFKPTKGKMIVFGILSILGILLFVTALVCHENYRPLTEEFIKLNPFITKPDIQGILVCSVTSLVWPTLLAPLYWYILSCLIILVYKKLREKIKRIKAIIAILILIFSAIIINGMYHYLSEYKIISNQKQTTKDYYQKLADKCTDDCCAQSVKTMRENDYKQMPLEGCPKDYQSNQLLCVSSYKWCEPKKETIDTSNTSPVSTSDWKTYTNSQHKFEFKYPNTYQISDKPEKQGFYDYQISKIVSSFIKENYIDSSSFNVFADSDSYNTSICLTNNYGVKQDIKDLTQTKEINGNKFYIFWDKQSDSAMGGIRGQISQYHIIHNNYCYILDFHINWHEIGYAGIINTGKSDVTLEQTEGQIQSVQKNEKILNQILSTFKFIK